ncbi:MAG: hypothetical protein KC621_03215, partial [Myxococcales bacterium]|nr:hypothetical protein [Myxococcales bacterium]
GGRPVVRVYTGGTVPESVVGVLNVWFPPRSTKLLAAHHWPGNLREFSMVAENAVLFALTEIGGGPPGERPDVVQVRPKLVRDLLSTDGAEPVEELVDAPAGAWRQVVTVAPRDTLNRVAVEVERQYFVALWRAHGGDFARMAEVLLGGAEHARKVQLRFNQLGLKVRELREEA